MKTNLYLLIIVLFGVCAGYAQNTSGTVIYKVQPDQSKMKTIIKDMKPKGDNYLKMVFKNIITSVPYIEYHLKFNEKESLFFIPPSMANDNGLAIDDAVANIGVTGVYYTDLEQRESLHQFIYITSNYLVAHDINLFNWELTHETKQILGHQCYKAITHYTPDKGLGDITVAWYAPDLPFQYGPMDYAGLPGLILEVKQGYYTFTASKIKFSHKTQKIEPPQKGKQFFHNEFLHRKNSFKKQYLYGGN